MEKGTKGWISPYASQFEKTRKDTWYITKVENARASGLTGYEHLAHLQKRTDGNHLPHMHTYDKV